MVSFIFSRRRIFLFLFNYLFSTIKREAFDGGTAGATAFGGANRSEAPVGTTKRLAFGGGRRGPTPTHHIMVACRN